MAIFATQYALSRRKHRRSALAVAQLDPGASNIVENSPVEYRNPSKPSIFARILGSLLPWNAPRLLGYQNVPTKDTAGKPGDEVVSAATLAVFQTENAMILNEAHSIPLTTDTQETSQSRKILNAIQTSTQNLAAITLAALHAGAFASERNIGEAAWAIVWVSISSVRSAIYLCSLYCSFFLVCTSLTWLYLAPSRSSHPTPSLRTRQWPSWSTC